MISFDVYIYFLHSRFKYSKFLYLLVFTLQISLFLVHNLISYVYSLIALWIIVLHNRCKKHIYFIIPYSICVVISLVTLLLDLLYSLNIISGDVRLNNLLIIQILQAIGVFQISSFFTFFTTCSLHILIIIFAILAISQDKTYDRPVILFFIYFIQSSHKLENWHIYISFLILFFIPCYDMSIFDYPIHILLFIICWNYSKNKNINNMTNQQKKALLGFVLFVCAFKYTISILL